MLDDIECRLRHGEREIYITGASGECLRPHAQRRCPMQHLAVTGTAIVTGDVTGGCVFWIVSTDMSPPMKNTILFLAANPLETDRLTPDQEARAIQTALERSRHRDQFDLVTRWAAQGTTASLHAKSTN